jgi:hypothetical protein
MILGHANTWNIFHEFWNKINLGIPEMTIHYEKMTSRDHVNSLLNSVIEFLIKNTFGYDANYLKEVMHQNGDQIKSLIKEPEYEHGTLVEEICGVEAARKLHSETHPYSNTLGYAFNNDTGHWSVKV